MQTAVVARQPLKVHTVSSQHIRLLKTLGIGARFMENLVYSFMDKLCAEYQGKLGVLRGFPYWHMVHEARRHQSAYPCFSIWEFLRRKGNAGCGRVIVTLFALNTLCYRFENEPKVLKPSNV